MTDYGSITTELLLPSTGKAERIVFLLEPAKVLPALRDQADRHGAAVASVFGMDWERDLSPWEAPRAFRKAPDFSGGAPAFLEYLCGRIVPDLEREAGLEGGPERRAVAGISLGGLFAVWAAMQGGSFSAAASVSGSFWFDSFTERMMKEPVSPALKKVYLSLGDKEKESRNPRFACVETETLKIKDFLSSQGVDTCFELNSGGHIGNGPERLQKALDGLMTM